MKLFKLFLINILMLILSTGLNSAFAQDNTEADQSAAPAPTETTPITNGSQTNGTQTNNGTQPNNMSTTGMIAPSSMMEKSSVADLKMAMRKLWEDHIVYTRNFIISALANLKDIDAVTKRLLKNQDDIGNAIKPFYGDEAGNQLSKLLREHIMIAAKVVKAAKANNKANLDKAQKEWTANADEIATFLSGANPNWSKEDLLSKLQTHLDLTTKETAARIQKNWTEEIAAYDENQDHMLMFSDALVDGIAKQFPDKMK